MGGVGGIVAVNLLFVHADYAGESACRLGFRGDCHIRAAIQHGIDDIAERRDFGGSLFMEIGLGDTLSQRGRKRAIPGRVKGQDGGAGVVGVRTCDMQFNSRHVKHVLGVYLDNRAGMGKIEVDGRSTCRGRLCRKRLLGSDMRRN